jgi:hypothetical protein
MPSMALRRVISLFAQWAPRPGNSSACCPRWVRLISYAKRNTQVWVVSHARRLVATLKGGAECNSVEPDKSLGVSVIGTRGMLEPVWKWALGPESILRLSLVVLSSGLT